MAGVPTGSSVERSTEGVLSKQRYQCDEALAEWRSCEQVENETPSTSLPYWDSDDSDYYLSGPKPSELYGSHTWNIDNFSQINTRELKSDTFEIGGRKWYILIYPQGCDVCNHLSLFLCVANHDNLLPGWGHFAQFTIGLVNKDPKKSKYSDTLHRFSKKEHDWGWKKFMELSKVLDGFIDADTLIIQAKVQVIRERPDRPFRCLDRLYRRELVRVYLANLEQIFWRFAEERQGKHGKLIADKTRWASLRAFWLGKDQKSRCDMSREKTGSILKVLVKHFFIEKEVTSTLVMDSLYSGLKALEGQRKGLKSKGKYLETEELSTAIIQMDKDTFVLVDDVLTLVERAAIEPLPPKDEKVPQNRTKDGSLGEEFNKDSTERDDRMLTEMGRRTIEMFAFAHIFSKIEVAYQEDVSLKRQEELIREEELACLAQTEQKARRGAADKEKKSKKKQGKQKRNNRKAKDKGKDDKHNTIAQIRMDQDIHIVQSKDFVDADLETALEKSDAIEDIVSDASDSVEFVPEILPLDSEDRDIDISELHPPMEAGTSGISGLSNLQNGTEVRTSSEVDDSSSASSSDSVPFVVVNGPLKKNSLYQKNRRSPGRETNHQSKVASDPADRVNAEPSQPSKSVLDVGRTFDASGSQVADRVVNGSEKRVAKEEESVSLHKTSIAKDVELEVSRDRALSLPISPTKNIPPLKKETKGNAANVLPTPKRYINKQTDQSSISESPSQNKFPTLKPTEKPKPETAEKIPKPPTPFVMQRPSSVNLAPTIQAAPFLPRSQSYYRNMIVDPGAITSFPYSNSNAPSQMVNPNQPSLWMESPINDVQSSDMYSSMQRPILQDDFPHLDIINELLDDEHGIGNPSVSDTNFQGFGDPMRSCRFDRPWSCYEEDGLQHGYGFSRTSYDEMGGPQAGFGVYGNGQVEDLVPHRQWQMGVSNHGFVGFGRGGSGSHRVGEYRNHPSGGVNGYSVFRQSSDL